MPCFHDCTSGGLADFTLAIIDTVLCTLTAVCNNFWMLKNITLSAEERLIQAAREKAQGQQSTLNEEFRRWLQSYVAQPDAASRVDALLTSLAHVNAGRKFTREEMNAR